MVCCDPQNDANDQGLTIIKKELTLVSNEDDIVRGIIVQHRVPVLAGIRSMERRHTFPSAKGSQLDMRPCSYKVAQRPTER
eukprot:5935004-Amphidinium_carterae.1